MSEENENLHDTAALRSLAMSLEEPQTQEEQAQTLEQTGSNADEPVTTDDFFEAAAEGRPAEVEEVSTFESEEREELVRVEKNIRQQNASAVAHIQSLRRTIQVRKIGIPILVAISVILFFISAATLYQANNALPEQVEGNPLLANAGLFSGICIFLGVALLGGVGFFAFEISRYNVAIKKIEASLR